MNNGSNVSPGFFPSFFFMEKLFSCRWVNLFLVFGDFLCSCHSDLSSRIIAKPIIIIIIIVIILFLGANPMSVLFFFFYNNPMSVLILYMRARVHFHAWFCIKVQVPHSICENVSQTVKYTFFLINDC